MEILRVINNNVVCAYNKNNKEVVVMGKGVGFNVREGDRINKRNIEKVFVMDDQSSINKFKELLEKLPIEHFDISNEIISYAKKTLQKNLNQNIYITLTDHISFAINRFKNGIRFSNPLLFEVKQYYKNEYMVGEYAVRLVEEKLGVQMSEDEAASIALYIVNAQINTNMKEALKITNLISGIILIIEKHHKLNLDKESLYYSRLITHLKFLAQRLFTDDLLVGGDNILPEMIKASYPEEYECSLKIKKYIEENFEQNVPEEELAYLAVHIRRVSNL